MFEAVLSETVFGPFPKEVRGCNSWFNEPRFAIPAAIYRSAQGPGPESAPRSAFWVFLGTWLGVLQRVLFECFLALFRLKKRPEALKKHSLGHSEPDAQKHSKSTPWGTFRPGALGTPVNGGRDRKPRFIPRGSCDNRLPRRVGTIARRRFLVTSELFRARNSNWILLSF